MPRYAPPQIPAARYPTVPMKSISELHWRDTRRPRLSATAPVVISKRVIAAVNDALTMNTWLRLSPASIRYRVLTPQIREAANVLATLSR